MKIINRLFVSLFLVILLVASPTVSALTQYDFSSIANNTPFYDPTACGSTASNDVTAGTGAPGGAQFPNLDPAAMAKSIDTFIKKHAPGSPLNDLGNTIVTSAQKSNINPFLVVAIANQETSLGTANTPQVTQAHNVFNRKATSSQPNVSINNDLWYQWSSVKNSVDYSAHENQNADGGGDFMAYLRNQYGSAINGNDYGTLFSMYDPGYSAYAANVKGWMREMIKGAQSATANAGGSTLPGTPGQPSAGGNDAYLLGDSILVGAYFDNGAPLKQALDADGWSSHADASGGRGMSYKGSDPRGNLPGKNDSGLDAIRADASTIKASDTVVIELGTNETNPGAGANRSSALFKSEMERAISEVKNINSSATIYWVNLFSNATRPYTPWVSQYNDVINSVARAKNINVIDTTSSDISLGSDGIHPDAAGYKTLSKLVATMINQVAADTAGSETTASCCPQASQGAVAGTLRGGSNTEKVFNFFVDKGLTPVQSAVITGRFYFESAGMHPEITNSIGAHGIAQWTNPPYSSRRPQLQAFARAMGTNENDLGAQLAFAWHELTTDYKGTLDTLKKAQTPGDIRNAEVNFEATYEVSGGYGIPQSTAYALRFLREFGGNGAAAGPSGSNSTNCQDNNSADVSGYQNPLRDVRSLRPERIDMGVDYAGEGPVYALGKGTIMNLINSGWNYGGYDAFISEKLSDGPAKGLYVFVAEACVPVHGLHVGQQVDSTTVICNMINPGSTGIETGWAQPPGLGDTIAIHNGGYQEGYATAAGENYNQLLVKLGAPSGVQQPRMGSLPPNWPTW